MEIFRNGAVSQRKRLHLSPEALSGLFISSGYIVYLKAKLYNDYNMQKKQDCFELQIIYIIGGIHDMDDELKIKLNAFTLDCKDPYELAKFYASLLQWEIPYHDDEYVIVGAPGTNQGAYPGITFQRNPEYKPPVWPEEPEAQQQMAHIDFAVNDLEKAVQYAVHCGATVAVEQFSDDWRVMFDPAGHPFCLCQMKHIFESTYFALR